MLTLKFNTVIFWRFWNLTLLYADDTITFATDPVTFQRNLNISLECTKLWKLNINYSKTNVMIFGIHNLDNFRFELDGNIIEIVDTFKYLGVSSTKLENIIMINVKKQCISFWNNSLSECTFRSSAEAVWPYDCSYSFILIRNFRNREYWYS